MLRRIDKKYDYLLICLFFGIIYSAFLGHVHLFDWDEINFAESAREMIVTGDYLSVQINFERFWEKPPLFFWLQVLSMKVFGINEFAARFPNAVCGVLSLLFIYKFSVSSHGRAFAWLWVLCMGCSILPFFYFKSGIIDPWFNLLIFTSLIYFFKSLDSERYLFPILSGILLGLACLTKGPVALLMAGLTAAIFLLVINKHLIFNQRFLKKICLIIITMMLSISIWVIPELFRNGTEFFEKFIEYQIRLFSQEDAGHGGPFFYHPLIVLLGCFPASAFLFNLRRIDFKLTDKKSHLKVLCLCLLAIVLVVFTIVQTKIIHYSSLAYFPLTYLASHGILKYIENKRDTRLVVTCTLILGTLIGLSMLLFPLVAKFKHHWIDLIKDLTTRAHLEAVVEWHFYEIIVGLIFLAGVFVFWRKWVQNKNATLPSWTKGSFDGVFSMFLTLVLSLTLCLYLFVPKIEMYSQNAAIEFYKSLADQDVYVDKIEFKSYAQLFYTKKQIPENRKALEGFWLLGEEIDKPTYFVIRLRDYERYKGHYALEELYKKNGFVFLKRYAVK